MKIKAELVQASNNLATSKPVYTFYMEYPRKSWLDYLGLSRYFESHFRTCYYISGTNITDMLKRAHSECRPRVYRVLSNQMGEVRALCMVVFGTVNNGRLNACTITKAVKLFGPRIQEVLKQYSPGESHMPVGLGTDHCFYASEKGWTPFR